MTLPPTLKRGLTGLDHLLARLVQGGLVLAFASILFLSAGQSLLRNFSVSIPDWIDPFLHRMVLWVGLLGAVLAVRAQAHVKLDLASHLLPARVQPWLEKLLALVSLLVCGLLARASWTFVMSEREAAMSSGADIPTMLGVPVWAYTTIIPLAFGLMAVSFGLSTVLPPTQGFQTAHPPDSPSSDGQEGQS